MSALTLLNTIALFSRAEKNPVFYSFQGLVRNGFWLRAPLYVLNFALIYLYFHSFSYLDDALTINKYDFSKPLENPTFSSHFKAQIYAITSATSIISTGLLSIIYMKNHHYPKALTKFALSTYIPIIHPKVELGLLLLGTQALNAYLNYQYIMSPQSITPKGKEEYDQKFLALGLLGTVVDCALVWSNKLTMLQSAVFTMLITYVCDSLLTHYFLLNPEATPKEKPPAVSCDSVINSVTNALQSELHGIW